MAGEALHRTAARCTRPPRTLHFDVLDFTSPAWKSLYAGSYLQIVNSAPELWGYLYQHTEAPPRKKQAVIRVFDRVTYKRYRELLKTLKPDALLCTHFLPYAALSEQVLRDLRIPVYVATTDFDVHSLWINPVVRRYFVFNEESAWQLNAKGVERERILPVGIPVRPGFQSRGSRTAARRALGIPENQWTTLVLAGGFGVGRLQEIARSAAEAMGARAPRASTLVVVCGRNARAKSELEATRFPPSVDARIHGFVDDVAVLMRSADVIVSKSGGLTSAEAMACGVPMIVIDPIPGQESRNADLLVEHGAGWKAINLPHLTYKLGLVMDDPARLRRARRAARALGRPDAARQILEAVLRDLGRTKRA
jgi:processive 1,2-diacylglycerol beta-glucosyltransferase